jgi:two-component system nitrogen regulation response regulator NtrX
VEEANRLTTLAETAGALAAETTDRQSDPSDAVATLETGYDWPGNVRELLNLVERLAILFPDTVVSAENVRAVLPGIRPGSATPGYLDRDTRPLRDRLDDYERRLVEGALAVSGGNVADAARRLQTDRANLYRRMKRLGLRDEEEEA